MIDCFMNCSFVKSQFDSFFSDDPSDILDNGYNITKEPIYANVNSKKQTNPIQTPDLFEYIRENKLNDCAGFKKEFGVNDAFDINSYSLKHLV